MRIVTMLLVAAAVLLGPGPETHALEPSGSVEFSGAGASLLPATSFDPTTFEGEGGIWAFFDATTNVGIMVWPLEADSTKATEVEVSEDGGESWEAIGQSGPVPGVSIEDGTVKFIGVVVPRSDLIGPYDLVIDGVLGRTGEVDNELTSLGVLKRAWASAR